MHRQAKVVDL